MARINIEDSLFSSKKYTKLCIELGDPEKALGAIVYAWVTAQKYYKKDRSPIPNDVWEAEGLNNSLISCGLAEKQTNGVYMKGSEDQFAWLLQRVEAGRKGGKAKSSGTKRSVSGRQAVAKPLTLTLTPSLDYYTLHPAQIDTFMREHQQQISEVQEMLNTMFQKLCEVKPPPMLKNSIPKMLMMADGDPEAVKEVFRMIIDSESFSKLQNPGDRLRYLNKVIKKELGVEK